jgi:hypothetical protein
LFPLAPLYFHADKHGYQLTCFPAKTFCYLDSPMLLHIAIFGFHQNNTSARTTYQRCADNDLVAPAHDSSGDVGPLETPVSWLRNLCAIVCWT